MFQIIDKILDEQYINFIIKNRSLGGMKDLIFNLISPRLDISNNILVGFSNKSKVINGLDNSIQRNKSFKLSGLVNMYCMMIFLNDNYNGGNIKLYEQSGELVVLDVKPVKGQCVIFDNSMYYNHDSYKLTNSNIDRMVLKTFIMVKMQKPVLSKSSSLNIIQNAISDGIALVSSPTRPLTIPNNNLMQELSTSPIFEFSPLNSPIDTDMPISSMFSLSNTELPGCVDDKKDETDDSDDDFNRSRTFSNPELPNKYMMLGRLGNHRLTSVSMLEFPTINPVTPIHSPVTPVTPVTLISSKSDLEKNTLYKRISKLYKKK